MIIPFCFMLFFPCVMLDCYLVNAEYVAARPPKQAFSPPDEGEGRIFFIIGASSFVILLRPSVANQSPSLSRGLPKIGMHPPARPARFRLASTFRAPILSR
jgi:hypothetical protein